MPLLHTWSLAVEEQFYIVFPLLLLALSKGRLQLRNIVLLSLFLASLLICEAGSRSAPVANFYLMPGRAWELLLGVGCTILLDRGEFRVGRHAGTALGLLGLMAVIASLVLFDRSGRLPSLLSLAPTLGAALIILFATNGTPAARLLSIGPLVGIGLASYSIYLWHYPILVFSRLAFAAEPTLAQGAILIAVIFAIGFVSWRFVETPFRNRLTISSKYIFVFSAAGVAGLVLAGYSIAATDGLASLRFGKEAVRFVRDARHVEISAMYTQWKPECNFYVWRPAGRKSELPRSCTDAPAGKPVAFLWGDSFMQALSSGLRPLFEREGWFVAQVATSDCLISLTPIPGRAGNACELSDPYALKEIARLRPDVVLMAQRREHDKTDWDAIAKHLKSLGVRRVILFGPAPQWQQSLPELVAYGHHIGDERLGLLDADILATDRALEAKVGSSKTLEFIPMIKQLCTPAGCLSKVPGGADNDLMALDYGHFSPHGAAYFVDKVRSALLPPP